MLGWGTFMLRKAAGSEAHIVVVSPDSPEMVAKNANRGERFWIDWIGPSTYLTEEKFVDFDAIDWLEIGIDTPEKKRARMAEPTPVSETQGAPFSVTVRESIATMKVDTFSALETKRNQ